MADANVKALQGTINRFAAVGGFTALGVDGVMGPKTAQGVLAALGWVAKGGCYANVCVGDDTVDTATTLLGNFVTDDGAIDQTQIATSAAGLATFLGQAATTVGLPAVAAPTTAVSALVSKLTLPSAASIKASSASALTAWKALPTWQKVGLGVAAGVVAIIAHKKIKERRQLSGYGW